MPAPEPEAEPAVPRTRGRKLLLSFSGKRAAGKDYVGKVVREQLQATIPGCRILRLVCLLRSPLSVCPAAPTG